MDTAVQWGEHSRHRLTGLYHRLHELLHEQWDTRAALSGDREGRVRFRGLFGDYALRFRLPGGRPTWRQFRVDRQAAMPLTLRL